MSSPKSAAMADTAQKWDDALRTAFIKVASTVVGSRQGSKCGMTNLPQTLSFGVNIEDIPEVTNEVMRVTQHLGRNILCVPLYIEISLLTADGETMVMEHWVLNMVRDGDGSSAPGAVGAGATRQPTYFESKLSFTKSVLCVSRSLPTYRMSRRQSSDSFVIMYRVFHGDQDAARALGQEFKSYVLSAVNTPVGVLTIRVDYRTNFTIVPSSSTSSTTSATKATNQQQQYHQQQQQQQVSQNSAGSTTGSTASSNFLVKDDHFDPTLDCGRNSNNLRRHRVDALSGGRLLQQQQQQQQQQQHLQQRSDDSGDIPGGGGAGTGADSDHSEQRIFAISPLEEKSAFPKHMSEKYNRNRHSSAEEDEEDLERDKVNCGAFVNAARRRSIHEHLMQDKSSSEDFQQMWGFFNTEDVEEATPTQPQTGGRKTSTSSSKNVSPGPTRKSSASSPRPRTGSNASANYFVVRPRAGSSASNSSANRVAPLALGSSPAHRAESSSARAIPARVSEAAGGSPRGSPIPARVRDDAAGSPRDAAAPSSPRATAPGSPRTAAPGSPANRPASVFLPPQLVKEEASAAAAAAEASEEEDGTADALDSLGKKLPFAARPDNDLTLFFRDLRKDPLMKSCLMQTTGEAMREQLEHLDEDLSKFEEQQSGIFDLIKTLETSESESEVV